MRDILALREIQRLSQDEGINLSGIKRILDLERELEQARRMAAELHAQMSMRRNERESTRAWAPRLAELRRSQTVDPAAALVPVRSSTKVTFWQAAAKPAAPQQPEAQSGDQRRAAD